VVPQDLRHIREHQWAQVTAPNTVRIPDSTPELVDSDPHGAGYTELTEQG